MTTPSGTITFANIQTEFGGSTPLSMSNYYASATGNVTPGSAGKNGFLPSSGTNSFDNFRSATKFVAQNSPGSSYSISDSSIQFDPSPGGILTYKTDGTWSSTTLNVVVTGSGNWGSPTTTSVGNYYYVRFTRTATSGSGGTSTASTGWLQLTANRAISVSRSTATTGTYTATYTIDLSPDTTNIYKTFTGVVFTATVT